MPRIFKYRGKTVEELQKMTLQEFARLVPARARRRLLKGFSSTEKKFVFDVLASAKAKDKKPVKTHCRDVVVTPQMIGALVAVHTGKDFATLELQPEHLGHRLGEFALTRKRVSHGAPGIGATKSSMFIPLK
ncbi:MAG: 30S ribosomal protein S19 [archaeon]